MQVPPFSLSKQLLELRPELEEAVLSVLHSGHYIGGKEVSTFEESFASSVGVPYAVGCNSGTDALILALRALDIGPGDEVITCSFSFFATAEAISAVGAKPVFVDVSRDDYLINLYEVEKVITPASRCILPVHLFGCPVNMEHVIRLATKFNLKVIEDCAQACGTKWNGRPVGSWGDIGCFSFFPTKNLGAAGDGGAITTNDDLIAQRVRELAIHGMPRRYLHTNLGYNSRLDAIQAAILNVKLPCLNQWIKQRQVVADRYLDFLKDIPGIEMPDISIRTGMVHSWNQFVVKVNNINFQKSNTTIQSFWESFGDSNNPRDILKVKLSDQGINTIIYYPIPIHLQPAYDNLNHKEGDLPVTEQLCKEVLSLPIFPEITYEEQDHVISVLQSLFL